MTASVAVALAARGVVTGTLAAAAYAKWRDRSGTRASLRALRLPVSLDRTLPVVEAFTALGLLVEQRTAWAAYVACALVALFTVFVAVLVTRGVHAPCPCFGVAAGTPTTGRTLARNILLLAVAVLGTAHATTDHWLIVVVAAVAAAVIVAAGRRSRAGAAARATGA